MLNKYNNHIILYLILFLFIIAKSNPITETKAKPISKEKEYFNNLVKKGLRLDNRTYGDPLYPFYEKIDYKKDRIRRRNLAKEIKSESKLRRLSDSQTLENLGFFDLVQRKSYDRFLLAFKLLISQSRKEDTNMVLYPYPFNYADSNNETKASAEGGVFTLDDSVLINKRHFDYLRGISSVQISKAKAIYDADIAIMSIIYEMEGIEIDLFTETSTFCEFFVNGIDKVSSCLLGKEEYLEYKVNYVNKGAVVRLSPNDILNKTLYDPDLNQLKIKLLIIPDYLTGNEETIKNEGFNSSVATVLNKYRSLGGHIITSGKGGYLLEMIGIIASGTFDTSQTISCKDANNINAISGCENIIGNSPTEQPDFFKQLICLGDYGKTYLVQAFPIKNIPSNFESLIKYTNAEKKLVYKKNGRQFDINDETVTYDYLLVTKEDDMDGKIMIVNGNPVKEMTYLSHIRNMMLYTMTKNILYDIKVLFNSPSPDLGDDLPVPAGEEGVQLNVTFKIYNLFDDDLEDVELDILIANLVNVVQYPEDACSIVEDNKFEDYQLDGINLNKYLKCSLAKIESLDRYNNWFKLEITHADVTQKGTDIPFLYSTISYKKKHNSNNKETLSPGIYYVQSRRAALLRATLNKDPISTYPLRGSGIYFDLILSVENKEITVAKEVNYVTLVPLITPLFGGQTQNSITRIVPLYEKYYEDHGFTYPWNDIDNRGVDYIDYIEIANKGVCYVKDFDTPVKTAMVDRSSVTYDNKLNPTGETSYDIIVGSDQGITAANVMKEIFYSDSENFYEKAKCRSLLFIDTSNEQGAKAYYGDNIPEDLVDPNNPKRAKRRYAWIREDTFFYKSAFDQYQIPNGLDYTYLLSIDKYEQNTPKTGKVLGDRKPNLLKEGYFDSTRTRYERLVPEEYSNNMLEYEYMQKLDPTDENDYNKLLELTNGDVKLSHYLIYFEEGNDITKADSIYGFVLDPNKDDGSGYLEKYPTVKFIYVHAIDIVIDPEISRIGGMVEIILPNTVDFNDVDPIKEERITTVADNVAFYDTKYNDHIIYIYFKRGSMPNENYGFPSKCKAYFENLNTKEGFEVTIKLHNLKYDFSNENFESLIPVPEATTTQEAVRMPFFSLPCLYIKNRLARKSSYATEYSDEIYEYELVNPFARYGGYFQELMNHNYIYGSRGAYHTKNPGLQADAGGFTLLSNIGTSSVPFAEFLETGQLSIPGVVTTSRIEWSDVWGRKWAQNLRTIYPESPPSPPSPLHFIMTTTYEILSDDRYQGRMLEWQSDESVYIRIQMKIRNTYELYWDPTICLANQNVNVDNVQYTDYSQIPQNSYPKIKLTFGDQYGQCYNSNEAYLQGQKLNDSVLSEMDKMMKCADTLDAEQMTQCSKTSEELKLPKLKKRPIDITDEEDTTPNHNWNYSPLVESYLPEGYINSNELWQLALGPHLDDAFHKGFPFHLDDCVPNFDNANTKPHDLIAFPIYKGIGYQISYDKNYAINKFSEYHGWWSDQLQNKDHTLLAGQDKVNKVAVGQHSLLKDEDWINVRELYPNDARFKNVYVCKFNQHRVKVTPEQTKYAVLRNVYQNNVIPILPDLTENDPRYTEYDCANENPYQYTPYNISEVDNRIYTANDRDWLYFAAGLRGNSRENVNVILKMDPISNHKFEGVTKVQDGGRFTYWEPPCGPNAYDYYDGNVNTVLSKRVDLTIIQRVFPTELYTFNSYGFYLFTVSDPSEENREYTLNTYMNSHGYGDSTVSIYVGGIDATSCKISAGQFTYVKIVFYNNAGFDWEMEDDAITMVQTGQSQSFNAKDLNGKVKRNIEYPSEYKFMSYIIPEEIKDYVTLTPSQHIMDIPSLFFDLTFNNILTIKDALEGDYFYCLNVSADFPEKYKGKMWEIEMKINEEYFKSLPGYNDPTGNYHDYKLTIPSIKFGVPLTEGEYAGKVFYNIGHATNLKINFRHYNGMEYQGIKIVNENTVNELSAAIVDSRTKFDNLLSVWNSYDDSDELTKKIKVSEYMYDYFYRATVIDLKDAFPIFPYEVPQNPYKTSLYFLVKTYGKYIPPGNLRFLGYSRIFYHDGRKEKNYMVPDFVRCVVTGPSLSPSFEHILIDFKNYNFTDGQFIFDYKADEDQSLYAGDTRKVLLTLTAYNGGTSAAYNSNFELKFDSSVVILPLEQTTDAITVTDLGIVDNERLVNVFYRGQILAKEEIKMDVYIEAQFGEKVDYSEDNSENRRNLAGNGNLQIVKEIKMNMCVENLECKKGDITYGEQDSAAIYNIEYINGQRSIGTISLISENEGTDLVPKFHLKAEIKDYNTFYNLEEVVYTFYRKIEEKDAIYVPIYQGKDNEVYDIPFEENDLKDSSGYTIYYKVVGEFPDKRTVDSNKLNTATFSYKIQREEINEDSNEKKSSSFPIYAIVLIILACLAILGVGGFLLYKYIYLPKKTFMNVVSTVESPVNETKKKRNLKNQQTVIKFTDKE